MPLSIADIPLTTALTADGRSFISVRWADWLIQGLIARTQTSPSVLGTVRLTGQHASIGSTAFTLGVLAAGLYRVNTYQRVTTPDGVSSSLMVGIGWTESAQALTRSATAMTGDTTGTTQGNVFVIQLDRATPLNYFTTYVSNTPGKMQYLLNLCVELVSAT